VIFGIGTDLCSIERMRESLERTPNLAQRLFHENEIALPVNSLAARFAAKEALAKAIGNPRLLVWNEIEIAKDDTGKPAICLHGSTKGNLAQLGDLKIHLSISHELELASAVVVVESN
jgi:holo-[acyl-carrier protein] synthase